jgi:hypothetical protein
VHRNIAKICFFFRELNFNLTIHNPYRAVEGLLIDIKTRCRTVSQVDTFRQHFFTFKIRIRIRIRILLFSGFKDADKKTKFLYNFFAFYFLPLQQSTNTV